MRIRLKLLKMSLRSKKTALEGKTHLYERFIKKTAGIWHAEELFEKNFTA
jgi:hypothetical protein